MPYQTQSASPSHSILRRREVEARTGLSRSTIYLKISQKQFPAPIKLGDRAVGFLAAEIDRWLQERIATRDAVQTMKETDLKAVSSRGVS
jgi:prophage regulatory protein